MRARQQKELDSLCRVHDFFTTFAIALGLIANLDVWKQLDAAIAAIFTHVNDQGTSDRYIAGQMGRQRALAQELIRKHMNPMAKFARAKLRGSPDFAALTMPFSTLSITPLIRRARTMAVAADKYSAQLTAGGFPPDAVARMNEIIDQLTAAMAQRARLRVARVGSTKAIESNLILGREGVKLLDAVISQQFVADEATLASWRSASRVEAKSGTVRSTPAPVVPPVAGPAVA